MQSKQESVTKEEESLTRFGWNGKMERERENDERREEEEESRGKEVFVLVVGVLDVLFFGFAENESKERFKSGYVHTDVFFLTRFVTVIKQELRCLATTYGLYIYSFSQSRIQLFSYISLDIAIKIPLLALCILFQY